MEELKPCPFCGMTPTLYESVDFGSGKVNKTAYRVECNNCRIHSSFHFLPENAVHEWNRKVEKVNAKKNKTD